MTQQQSDRTGQPATEAAYDPLSPQEAAIVTLFASLPSKRQRALLDRLAPVQPPTLIPAMTEPDRWLRPAEAADMLGLCVRTLRRYARTGRITPRQTYGRAVRYRLSELQRVFRPVPQQGAQVS